MNRAQLKLTGVFSIFAIIGFGPISPGCLIGLYIVMARPLWFRQLINEMYQPQASAIMVLPPSSTIRIRCLLGLLTLLVIDILPIPVTPMLAFFIILRRPEWFYQVVEGVYRSGID